MKILIVEDSSFTRGLVRRDLSVDHEVIEAQDGLAGLVALMEREPELVLVDLLMPHMDGFEFLARAREAGYEGPVVVCSANTQPSVERRIRELGGTLFVAKPELLIPGRARALIEDFMRGLEADAEGTGDPNVGRLLRDGLRAVADVFSQVTGRDVNVECVNISEEGEGEASADDGAIHVRMSIEGGLCGTGHVMIPDAHVLDAATEELGPLPPPKPSDQDVATEVANMLINAFAGRFATLSGREVVLSLPECSTRFEDGASPEEPRVVMSAALSVSECNEATRFRLVTTRETFARLQDCVARNGVLAEG